VEKPTLQSVIFCQPDARHFSGVRMGELFHPPDRIAPSRAVSSDDLPRELASAYLRISDVPLAFQRESPGLGVLPAYGTPRPHTEMGSRLEKFGRMLQYRFTDGTCLSGSQILYHPYSKDVPRHLLPLNVNVKADLADRTTSLIDVGAGGFRPAWQAQGEKVLLSILLAAVRVRKQKQMGDDDGRGPDLIYLTLSDVMTDSREAIQLDTIELGSGSWGPWRLNAALPVHPGHAFYGRARIELDPEQIPDTRGLSRTFFVDSEKRALRFHSWEEQLTRLSVHAPKPVAQPSIAENRATQPLDKIVRSDASAADAAARRAEAAQAAPVVAPPPPQAKEQGINLHLTGHAAIQATIQEINDMLEKDGRKLPIFPQSVEITDDRVKPRLRLTSDGTMRMTLEIDTPVGHLEAHGLPQGSLYLLLNLQLGLGGTTGYSVTQLAHARRGAKRERDLKVLRHLGFSSLIFYDACLFALGQPLSDGSVVNSETELLQSLYVRLGQLVLKSEGFPGQEETLLELCSKNVTTLIEGFVRQVILDLGGALTVGAEKPELRETRLYLPEGEFRVRGIPRFVAMLFYSLVADLAANTEGTCFGRARTKYFETFLNNRTLMEREDLVVREHVDAAAAAKMVYQPGISERFLLPETSLPLARAVNLLALMRKGFDISIDGKVIEEFDASDFRPEFTLVEGSDEDESGAPIPLGHQKINWFELSPKFFFKGTEITSDQANRLSKEGMIEFQGKLFRVKPNDMPSLKRLTAFWASIQSKNATLTRSKRRKTEDTYYQLPRSQTLELLALRAGGVKVRGGPLWDQITKFYDSLSTERELHPIPDSFKTTLQPYQHAAVQWLRDLRSLGLGGILADDMGLGKTVTSLAFLEVLRSEGRMGRTLVMVPTSLTYNWASEAEKFTPDMPAMIFSSKQPEQMLDFIQKNEHSIVICTYGLLQESSQLFQQVEWDSVIFDEAQNLKNITTKRTTAARQLRSNFKLCLTGTPLENHYGEFYSLFDLIVPGSLGELSDFREKYVNPVRVLREDIDFLKLKSKPLLMRRTKAQVMSQLPPKIETTIKLPFEEGQKKIYRDIASSYNEQIRSQIASVGEAKMQLQMLTALLRLRQACSDPSAIPGVKYDGEPPKITTLVEAVSQITQEGESALVFTQFLATFERIKRSLAGAEIPFFDISGADSRLAREKKLRAFQEETRGSVMLMTLKTGGVGLNLTKASYVFHIEPWWNPAVENQATDRAHRIGQTSMVQVFRYLIKESVEEKIEVLKDVKAKRFDALFSVNETEGEALGPAGNTLTQRDFEYLLS
jgi:superfamily II DNA or RNA helicase